MDSISTVNIVAVAIQAFVCLVFPVFALVYWHKKTSVSVKPAFMAVGMFFIFAFILKSIVNYFVIGLDSSVKEFLTGNAYIKAAYVGLATGVFEEISRLVGFRLLAKKSSAHNRRTAVTYGIGHGGFEMFAVVGLASLASLFLIAVFKIIGQDVLLAYMQQDASTMDSVIELFSSMTPSYCFFMTLECLSLLAIQISLSVMVFAALRDKKKRWLFPAAILLHASVDFPTALYSANVIHNIAVVELIIAVLACLAVYIGLRVYKGIAEPVNETTKTASEANK